MGRSVERERERGEREIEIERKSFIRNFPNGGSGIP
jgi:hypothetical protein